LFEVKFSIKKTKNIKKTNEGNILNQLKAFQVLIFAKNITGVYYLIKGFDVE